MNKLTKIFADKIISRAIIISSSIQFLTLCSIGYFYRKLPPLIPLYNQRPWGQTRLGNKAEIFFPSLVALVIFFINLLICRSMYEKMPLVARILTIMTLLTSITVSIFIFRTIQLML